MNQKQISYCLELSRTLSFSQAAENLFVSQPSMSYQIQQLEDEVGFRIFDRVGRGGVTLTTAGAHFCSGLTQIQLELKNLVEQSQNISVRYRDTLNVCLPLRGCIQYLPEIIQKFEAEFPETSLNVKTQYGYGRLDAFLRREQDILFERAAELRRFRHVRQAKLFDSGIYVVIRHDDPLARLSIITQEDLRGRRLMIGGGSPPELVAVQNRVVASGLVEAFNCPDHDAALINVASRRGIVLSPGFVDDHTEEFAWIPFDCEERITCVLAVHEDDHRPSTNRFIELVQSRYR